MLRVMNRPVVCTQYDSITIMNWGCISKGGWAHFTSFVELTMSSAEWFNLFPEMAKRLRCAAAWLHLFDRDSRSQHYPQPMGWSCVEMGPLMDIIYIGIYVCWLLLRAFARNKYPQAILGQIRRTSLNQSLPMLKRIRTIQQIWADLSFGAVKQTSIEEYQKLIASASNLQEFPCSTNGGRPDVFCTKNPVLLFYIIGTADLPSKWNFEALSTCSLHIKT